jgi:predicted ribosome quality control (RQC) complex YloA/Tae2 family protein
LNPKIYIHFLFPVSALHQNYYFLKKLAPSLHEALAGKLFVEAFSQEKDELVLIFADAVEGDILEKPFFVKATLRANFASLSFPDSFQRARRNSVNLFGGLYGKQIDRVQVFLNERALEFRFGTRESLVFKLFGNRSNIIAFDQAGGIFDVFNHKLTADQSLSRENLDRPIDQSFQAYLGNGLKHAPLFPTFGKLVNKYLDERLTEGMTARERWGVVEEALEQIEQGPIYLTTIGLLPTLSLLPVGEVSASYQDPVEALNAFYYAYIRLTGIEKEKAEILRILRKRIQQTENYLENTFNKLAELEGGSKNDELANILMANLHQIPARAESVELYDFYRDKPVQIKLKKDLSPQKNAEGYYRKSKNEKIELEKLNESLSVRESEKVRMEGYLAAIEGIGTLRELRAFIKSNGLGGGMVAVQTPADLFKRIEYQQYTILIGRNAKNNDLLTKQYAFKEDLWLHARDVPGSHVVIKYQPGKKFPSIVIERAAELAAFYSKRKTDSLCPVIVTPKKYVRKPKGMPEGAVVIDKEDVVMVVPRGD